MGGVSEYQAGYEFGKVLRTLLFSLKGISIIFLLLFGLSRNTICTVVLAFRERQTCDTLV